MDKSIKKIYEMHHETSRKEGFTILEKERGEIIKKYIGQGQNILDIGCRDGALTKYFVNGNDVLGTDIDEKSLNKAKENLNIKTMLHDLNGDWHELEGRKFDIIFAGEVLEHLYYPENVIKKVKAHLNQGGMFVGSVPSAFSIKNRIRYALGKKQNTPLEDPTHINHFSYDELTGLFNKYFKDVKIIGLGRYKRLIKLSPSNFSFNLFFVCKL